MEWNRWRLLAGLAVLPIFDACLGYAIGSTIWRPPGDSTSGNTNTGMALAGIAGFWGLLVAITAVPPGSSLSAAMNVIPLDAASPE